MGKGIKKRKGNKALEKIRKFFLWIKERHAKEYAKRLLNFLVINCILMMWASYFLAYIGMDQIAETLSATACNAVIVPVTGYLVKSVIENVSKYGWNTGGGRTDENQNTESQQTNNNGRAE